MHDIIENVLNEYGIACYRIDGTVAGRERQLIIDEFNDEKQGEICMSSHYWQLWRGHYPDWCGSCGDFDPSWNPAQDRQAVDRGA